MKNQDFIEKIINQCDDSDNIFFSITKAKGVITLFWSLTHLETNSEAYKEHIHEITQANQQLDLLEQEFPEYFIKKRKLLESDAEHFDFLARTTKKTPVKRAYETDTQSMGGYIQFHAFKE